MEVTGYIDHNVSMQAQLGWKVEILNPDPTNEWKVIESQVRLVHVNTSASMKVLFTSHSFTYKSMVRNIKNPQIKCNGSA